MGKNRLNSRLRALVGLIAYFIALGIALPMHGANAGSPVTNYTILDFENIVLVEPAGSHTFKPAVKYTQLLVGDRVRVGTNSSLLIQRADESTFRVREKSEFVIPPPKTAKTSTAMRLLSGALYFLHRGKPGDLELESPTTTAAIRGTEFNFEVADNGTTMVTVVDGIVDFRNEVDHITVQSGQQGVAEPGKAPVLRAAVDAINVIQWTLYYPGILDLDEIELTDQERGALSASLDNYRAGDLLRAIKEYPTGREPQSNGEKIYLAELTLAVGKVDDAQKTLAALTDAGANGSNRNARLAGALRQVIGAVKLKATAPRVAPELATERLAESYRLQSQADLEGALKAARAAVQKSPNFGFGWERIAELEFSFGRVDAASEALSKSLEMAPRNAQAIALEGFLLAAQNKMDSAIRLFDAAIDVDGRLANAWLGRGLALIRKGRSEEGRQNLMTAAALEPQRAFLRSYLGKAWIDAGQKKLAEHELELAEQFDERDPTAWLYSALLKEQQSRINEAISDLEHAKTLNTNRAVYRSQFMLDLDRAVQSANLAHVYRDVGMIDWSVREAGRAVAADYANYSAHLFLANSYDQLQDPNRINLRYETATESEYLIANLLAPVGAGTLSRSVSQGEYSKLFEHDRVSVASTTEYLSRGAWYENGAQFGIFGNTAYSLEGIYRSDPGQRVNNDFEERDLRVQVKQQLTYKDSVFIRGGWLERSSGDELQDYNPGDANPFVRTRERHEPVLTLGYDHEWNPQVHTLLLATHFDGKYWVENPQQRLFFVEPGLTNLVYTEPIAADLSYRNSVRISSGEAQQIWQNSRNTLTVGGRFQRGDFDTMSTQSNIQSVLNYHEFTHFVQYGQAFNDTTKTPFERLSLYAYDGWRTWDELTLFAGITYDRIVRPVDFASPPISNLHETTDQTSPKAGFVWTPWTKTTVRGAYSRSLSGASVDQSLTIEPSQVAGLNQAFRSLASESIVGSDIAARFETFGVSIEQSLPTRTYVSALGELFYSEDRRAEGVLASDPSDHAAQSVIQAKVNYRERAITLNIDQLLSKEWSVGSKYRLTDSLLENFHPEVPAQTTNSVIPRYSKRESTLHQLDLHANFNHPSGFFAEAQTVWYKQSNWSSAGPLGGDDFWQVNLIGGYRFLRRRAEIALGLLNVNDQDYRLNPLNPYLDLPRERTFMLRGRLNF